MGRPTLPGGRYRVLKYEPEPLDYHLIKGADGWKHRIDLMADGKLTGVTKQELVGKLIHIDYAHPYLLLAANPRIIPEEGKD